MRILYIGCVISSKVFLESIITNTNAEIVGIVTKTASAYNADHASLDEIAIKNNIDWIDYSDHSQLLDFVKHKKPDIIYCFGWSYLLPAGILSIPTSGAVGYHPTQLPYNRGRHPIIWTIVLGLRQTASTFFKITDEADAGDILSQKTINVSNNDDANTLYKKLITAGATQIIDLTNQFINNTVQPRKQDVALATTWRKRSKQDGKIDWRMSAINIDRLVRALTRPYIGAHFEVNGKDIKVWRSRITDLQLENAEPGKIIKVKDSCFQVNTGDYVIEIIEYDGDFTPIEGGYL